VLYEGHGSLSVVEMETESVDCGSRDVVVDDCVEIEKGALAEGGTAEVAALELAFCSFGREPWLLGEYGSCLGGRGDLRKRSRGRAE
jgi:hypothetical protein